MYTMKQQLLHLLFSVFLHSSVVQTKYIHDITYCEIGLKLPNKFIGTFYWRKCVGITDSSTCFFVCAGSDSSFGNIFVGSSGILQAPRHRNLIIKCWNLQSMTTKNGIYTIAHRFGIICLFCFHEVSVTYWVTSIDKDYILFELYLINQKRFEKV